MENLGNPVHMLQGDRKILSPQNLHLIDLYDVRISQHVITV